MVTIIDQKTSMFGYFIRTVNNYAFYCSNNEIIMPSIVLIMKYCSNNEILFTKELQTKYLEPIKVKKLKKCKIITFDIETVVKLDKGIKVHKPYLFSMFDGKIFLV